jgi:ubiquinone/menaquinone biosynthesis C-methylase UbiE
MEKLKQPFICPAEFAGTLDNPLRRIIHNPGKILASFITKGMTVIDLGCGPGYFTIDLARLVGEGGKVIAADLQQEMLDRVIRKIKGTDLESRILIHKCQDDKTGLSEKADFVLAFWMIHEVPDRQRLFGELKSILKSGGRILIIEPKIHVTGKSFRKMILLLESAGFAIIERPKICLSRSVLLSFHSDTL